MKGFVMRLIERFKRMLLGAPVEEQLRETKAADDESKRALECAFDESAIAREELEEKAETLRHNVTNGLRDRTTQVIHRFEKPQDDQSPTQHQSPA